MTTPRTFLVTGATGAIGLAIARQLAHNVNHRVVLLARNEGKAQAAIVKIQSETGHDNVTYQLADLSRRGELVAFAQKWQEPLHVLINNAAIAPRNRQETTEGIEMQWAVNVLSYLWLTDLLTPALQQANAPRVVNVASYWAGDLDLSDVEFKRRPYRNGTAYRQSKQANRMLTVMQAETLAPLGITVNVCHPGEVRSSLSGSLGFGGSDTPAQGADTPVWLATAPDVEAVSGKYFEARQARGCRFAADRTAVQQLWALCGRYA